MLLSPSLLGAGFKGSKGSMLKEATCVPVVCEVTGRVIDGKIAEEVGLDDGVTALTQLGLLRAA